MQRQRFDPRYPVTTADDVLKNILIWTPNVAIWRNNCSTLSFDFCRFIFGASSVNSSSLETISRRAEWTCVLGPHPPSLIAPLHAPAPAMSPPLLWSLPQGLTNLDPALEALWWPLAPKNAHVVCPLLASEEERMIRWYINRIDFAHNYTYT